MLLHSRLPHRLSHLSANDLLNLSHGEKLNLVTLLKTEQWDKLQEFADYIDSCHFTPSNA